MPLSWSEASEAIRDAEATIQQADNRVIDMARLICGKLRSAGVRGHTLSCLKKELREFDMRNSTWNDR